MSREFQSKPTTNKAFGNSHIGSLDLKIDQRRLRNSRLGRRKELTHPMITMYLKLCTVFLKQYTPSLPAEGQTKRTYARNDVIS